MAEQIPLLALFSAASHAAIFILFGRLTRILFPLPLLTLITLLSLPLLYVWSAVKNRRFTVLLKSRAMLGPILLSFLLFPGFLLLFSRAYAYSDALKLVSIYLSVVLLFEVWIQKRRKKAFVLIGSSLAGLLALSLILSQGLTLWPLLWAEGAMTLAAASICLYRLLLKSWCQKNSITRESAHFWSVVWTLPWLLAAMWISGRGLPLPPVSRIDLMVMAAWGALFHLALFFIEEYRVKKEAKGDFLLILFFFLPAFVTILGFLESGYWPDMFDLAGYGLMLAGIVLLSYVNPPALETGAPKKKDIGVGDE